MGAAGSGGTGGTIPDAGADVSPDAVGTGGSGGSNQDGGGCAYVAVAAEPRLSPVDLVAAVDSSLSMFTEMTAVQASLNGLVQSITASGIDVRLVLLAAHSTSGGICVPAPLGSGSCPDDSKPPGLFHHPNAVVDSSNGAVQFVERFNDYKPTLRASSKKHLVIVTDDDSSGPTSGVYKNDAARFVTDYTNLDPSLKAPGGGPAWRMSGMYGQTQCANASNVGQVWKAIIDRTGGIHGDLCECGGDVAICNSAVQSFMARVAGSVINDAVLLECEWKFPVPPSGPALDPSRINVQLINTGPPGTQKILPHVAAGAACDARGGWYYDNATSPSAIIACPVSCDEIKATPQRRVEILAGCKSIPPGLGFHSVFQRGSSATRA